MKNTKIKAYSTILSLLIIVLLPVPASSTDIYFVIENTQNNMSQELETQSSKQELEAVIYNLFEARVELTPRKYEKERYFKDVFEKNFNSFHKLLWKSDLKKIACSIDKKSIKEMTDLYYRNQNQYKDFVNNFGELGDNFLLLKKSSPDLLLKSQIYFSLILLGGDKESWENGKWFSPAFPFCDPPPR